MGYINRVVSRYSIEEDFAKTLANFLNSASNKIVWNENEATLVSQMTTATGSYPTLTFNILEDFLLACQGASSGQHNKYTFLLSHEDFNTAFINTSLTFTTESPAYPEYLINRTYRFKIITNNNSIFISINNSLYMFFIKTSDFIGVSAAIINSGTPSPLASSFGLKIKKIGEDEWKTYTQINRLEYLYNPDDTQELEIIRNKVFLEPGAPTQKGIVIDSLFDCSYFNSPGTIIELNQQKYYVIDEYTLMKIEQEGR